MYQLVAGPPHQCVGLIWLATPCSPDIGGHQRGCGAIRQHAEPIPMPKVEVKRVRASATISDREPHWIVEVDYGAFEVQIPLPAHYLQDNDFQTQRRQSQSSTEPGAIPAEWLDERKYRLERQRFPHPGCRNFGANVIKYLQTSSHYGSSRWFDNPSCYCVFLMHKG
jgi:hypothetical protein